jgi:hypothetical protein
MVICVPGNSHGRWRSGFRFCDRMGRTLDNRRLSIERISLSMTDRSAFQVFDRTALTKRLIGKLKREEAVIGGIGNTNFDLFATGRRPQNFYMLGSMGLACPIALGVAMAQPQRGVISRRRRLDPDGARLPCHDRQSAAA